MGAVPQELDDEFAKIFANDYIGGLDAVLESRWFSTNNNALNRILGDKSLHEEAAHFADVIKYRSNSAEMAGIYSQEARLIWHMLGVCKQLSPTMNGTNGTTPSDAASGDLPLREVRARFEIVEALLTNQNLQSNPIHHMSYAPDSVPAQKKIELDFWEALGNFVVHADSDSSPAGAADHALSTMRNVLQAVETRDALYSIAIARYLGNRIRGFPNGLPPPTGENQENDLNKLHVAMGFISYESRVGLQQVIARICDMAMLSWTVSRPS
jgi:hypothetical protein